MVVSNGKDFKPHPRALANYPSALSHISKTDAPAEVEGTFHIIDQTDNMPTGLQTPVRIYGYGLASRWACKLSHDIADFTIVDPSDYVLIERNLTDVFQGMGLRTIQTSQMEKSRRRPCSMQIVLHGYTCTTTFHTIGAGMLSRTEGGTTTRCRNLRKITRSRYTKAHGRIDQR